ncbi:winged helix DNA-binding domain-containing protein [Actinoplanes sp. NEAU-A12]|uniref:Winged helix DNA-binding domain-containing protein n=1 Tax=Actinoplanes sandaracinus TaxID=3045177 RepID=A0ABT6X0I6_9ACTN|nr:winged helix DNA-binding domain-containing protein [Actinoplanes sandaracinus]MDI6105510.1 winged helix DNA-binding domain-containing protein [Actinoplanes sandaracinus]
MDANTALSLRMTSLLLGSRSRPGVPEIVEWFGAMQAQDLNSVLWSLGARLPGVTLPEVVAATEERTVVRTWPMRGTVHLVPSADAHWMLDLTGVRALTGVAKRWEYLGLDEKTAHQAMDVLAAAITAGGGRLTRSACLAALTDGGISVEGQRGYHLLWYVSQRGVTAIAPNEGSEQTFVLLDEWVTRRFTPASRDEALTILAGRYFRSHGPTTVKDFAGWTGLPVGDARKGVAAAKLERVDVDGVEMWADPEVLDAGPVTGWWALPGFDEYMLGYKDRSMMATPEQVAKIIPGGNGVFQSTLVRDGRVMATWKRTLGKKAVTVTVLPLADVEVEQATRALEPYAAFVGLPLVVKIG